MAVICQQFIAMTRRLRARKRACRVDIITRMHDSRSRSPLRRACFQSRGHCLVSARLAAPSARVVLQLRAVASVAKGCNVGVVALAAFCIVACSSGDDGNLWHRDFSKSQARAGKVTSRELTGYWEGDIAMGSVRAKIESGKITLAIRCDSE